MMGGDGVTNGEFFAYPAAMTTIANDLDTVAAEYETRYNAMLAAFESLVNESWTTPGGQAVLAKYQSTWQQEFTKLHLGLAEIAKTLRESADQYDQGILTVNLPDLS